MIGKTPYGIILCAVAALFSTGLQAAEQEPAMEETTASEPVEERLLVMGSGDINGTYYPVAGAICRILNKDQALHGNRCLVDAGGGSAVNIQGLREETIDLALVQSMAQYQSYRGEGAFRDEEPFVELRSLLSLHGEALVVVAARDSGIESLSDLVGKRVNLGHPGSFQRTMADLVLEAFKWSETDFSNAMEIEPGSLAKAVCGGQVDAVFLTGAQPLDEVNAMLRDCEGQIIDVKGGEIDALLEKHPYLSAQTLPATLYGEDVETIGVVATLVTTAKMPETVAYEIVKAVMENFGPFSEMHLALSVLEQEKVATAALTAPLHPGAERYFRQDEEPAEEE